MLLAIPARMGGPAAFYFQALKGLHPYPVSVAELDRRGRVLSVRALHRVTGCTPEPQPRITRARLASGTSPDGEAFSIEGTAFQTGHHVEFTLGLLSASTLRGGGERDRGGPGLFLDHRCPRTSTRSCTGCSSGRRHRCSRARRRAMWRSAWCPSRRACTPPGSSPTRRSPPSRRSSSTATPPAGRCAAKACRERCAQTRILRRLRRAVRRVGGGRFHVRALARTLVGHTPS